MSRKVFEIDRDKWDELGNPAGSWDEIGKMAERNSELLHAGFFELIHTCYEGQVTKVSWREGEPLPAFTCADCGAVLEGPDEGFLYRLGVEYAAKPESHEHFDGCGHAGEGVEVAFLNGWRDGRRVRR